MYSKPSKKYWQIIFKGKELFWKYGFSRVTIEEVCRKAGVSKMTFYKWFDNKNDLVIKLLDHIFKQSYERYEKIMKSEKPFSEKVREMVQLKIDSTNDISKEFLTEYFDTADEELKNYLKEKSNEMMASISRDFIEAQRRGEIREDIGQGFIIYFFGKMIEMANDKNLMEQYETAQDLIIEMINFFFYGISPREENEKKG